MRNLESYGLKSIYKGKFLKFVDDNWMESRNLDAYIAIDDIILNKSGTEHLKDTITIGNILNKEELNLESEVTSVNSIICKPLYINKICPILSEGEDVFVVIFDSDPKKIFYMNVATELPEEKEYSFMLRIGRSVLFIDKDEIRLTHELPDPKSDNGITVSEFGIEMNGENILVNGTNIGDLTRKMNTIINELNL